MKKLLKWHDAYTLKILVSFLILFTALYPKLPSVHIVRTWVYIRLEDFFILGTVLIWFVQLLRRKVSIPLWISGSIGSYWIVGLISLIFSIIYIAPGLRGFFPHVAILSFVRRIEYMILFFVAYSTIKSKRDIRDYFIVLASTILFVFLYGLGQKYYIFLWEMAPDFFRKYSFCFPSFQTGNEEFAKGVPLCLPKGARITSTFGGSYDLAAYLVLVLPVILGAFIAIKKWYWKIVSAIIFTSGLTLLIFTSQRAAFIAYLVGSIVGLVIYKKKLYIIPLVILSVVLLLIFSQSTAKRFLSTLQVRSVVVDTQGRLIGQTLPKDLKNKIEKPQPAQDLPQGSAFLALPVQTAPVATNTAIVKKALTPQEIKRLQLAEGSIELSTVTGSFLVKKVLVYDISFTTRFQAEWPNAWRAFLRNPLLGSGYSSITLATDNDYLRALGETGILGLFSFIGIFLMLFVTLKKLIPNTKSDYVKGYAYGLAGGVVGLALNAMLIDVFEASKVAENLWFLLGIGTGGLMINSTKPISYKEELRRTLISSKAFMVYLFFIVFGFFFSSVSNFFVADDFTWLYWAATDTISHLPIHFINAQNFFYRPLDKIVTYFLYTVFSFQPQGYHIFILFLHFLSVLAVYILSKKILKQDLLAFFTAVLFALLPVHAENIFWFSGLSGVMASTFILYAAINFWNFRTNKSVFAYILTFVLSILAFCSYEIAVITPLIFIVMDIFILRPKKNIKSFLSHIPFLSLIPIYYFVRIISKTFIGGGDYSYNMAKLVPNVIGNFFGYIGLFLFGNNFLPFYDNVRNGLRGNSVQFSIIFLISLSVLVVVFYYLRKKILQAIQSNTFSKIGFGIAFAIVALIPFLALGNIATRYLYLASFGFCLSLIIVIKQIVKKQYLIIILVVLLAIWYQGENSKLQNDWHKAGEITIDTLALFRVDYESLKSSDNLYFVNTPVTYKRVWVFPTGLSDGLWFIYTDHLPKIYQLSSPEEVETVRANAPASNNYIFKFDKDGKISKIN